MSNFDPEIFLDSTTTEVQVKRPPIPAGSEVVGTIKNLKMRNWQGSKDPTKSGIALDLQLEIDLTAYPDIYTKVGADKVTLRDSLMLDQKEDGSIDYGPGKNSKLRRYREALGLNVLGQPFSFRMMEGRQVTVKVKHREYEGELYDDVDAIAKA